MLRLMVYVVPVALAIYALIDLYRSEPRERAGIPVLGWLAIVVLLPVVGPIAWILVSRTQGAAGGGAPRRPVGPVGNWPVRRPGPKAPDDDPDFLWRLEQERRRARDAGGQAGGGGRPADGGTPDDAPEGP